MPRGNGKGKFAKKSAEEDQMQQLQTVLTDAAYVEEDLGLTKADLDDILKENSVPTTNHSTITIPIGQDLSATPELAGMIRRVSAIFRTAVGADSPKAYDVHFYPPMPVSKTASHVIHPFEMVEERHLMHRVVFVIGSPELFDLSESRMMGGIIGQKKVYLRSGHGIRMNVGPANMISLRFDDRDIYDRTNYPGRGIKNPTTRWIVVIDMLGGSAEDAIKVSQKEAEKFQDVPGVEEAMKAVQADPGMFAKLLSTLTGGYM